MRNPIKLITLLCCVLLFAKLSHSQVKINEYSASNLNTFTDNFGGYEDWIELYNPGATAINLNGWGLSDKVTNMFKWKFGNVTIPAGGFLRIWASNKNINVGANLHTSYGLKQCQYDKIILSNASMIVQDSLTMKKTQAGHSRGRSTDGATTWSVFTTPTPNASNNTSTAYSGYATTPSMNFAQAFYPSPITVAITSPDPGVTIKYTVNGSTPSSSGILYATAIPVNTTTVIRAQAFSSNPSILTSFCESNTYFINVTHSVNVISVFGDDVGTLLGGASGMKPEAGLEYFDHLGIFKTEGYGEANKHGNDSWAYAQRGFDFVCRDEHGINDALHHQIFNSKPRTEFQRIIVKAGANDNYKFEGTPNFNFPGELGGAHIRDQYVHTVSQKAGLHVDERTWAPGVVYVNGAYWGVYDIREKVDDKDFTKYYYDSKEDSLQFLQTWGPTWSAYGGTQAQTDWNNLKNFITGNSMTVPANYNYVDGLLNTKSLADYVILNSYVVCSDWLNWNTAWWRGLNYKCDKQKWRYALWDEDATFKHYINYTGVPNVDPNANPCDPQSLGNPGSQGHVPILNALLQNPSFKQYYVMRYFDLINTGLSCKRMTDILDSMILVITPEMPGQIARWGGTMTQWQANCTALKSFIQARCDSVTVKFNNCYNVTGPYKIKVNVDPPNAGTVEFNSINIASFVWQGTYPGNLLNNLKAHVKPNYCFSHWTTKTHTLSPNMSDSVVSINLTANDSVVAHFIYNPKPIVTPNPAMMCAGDSIQFTATNGVNYSWTPSTGLSCTNCPNPMAFPPSGMNYVVTSFNNPTCKASTPVALSVAANPQIMLTQNSATWCASGTNTIQLQAFNGVNYNWSPNFGLSCLTCSAPIANPNVTTVYTVSSITNTLCMTSATFTLNIQPYAIAGFTAITTQTNLPQPLTITNTSSLATSYSWYFNPGGISSTDPVPAFVASTAGTHTIMMIAYGSNGCNDTLTQYISINDTITPFKEAEVIFPNIFSPNKDGINDYFAPSVRYVNNINVLIYDRWGKLVYEIKGDGDVWYGENKAGAPAGEGTYFYIFTGKNTKAEPMQHKGYVQLVR
jgi:gliding motility-associated-like protein